MKAFLVLGLAVILAPGLAAQQRDSVRQPGDTAEAEQLRTQIEQRFSARVQQELKLTNEQTAKLRDAQARFGPRRQTLMRQQMDRRRALEDQMQPGVAANQDSVRKLMDGLTAGRLEMVKIQQDENRELAGFLTPVQQYRYNTMRERLMQRVGEMRRQGRGMGRAMGRSRGQRMDTRVYRRRGI
jgi:Spy/CpxP family protein refolding chaperone